MSFTPEHAKTLGIVGTINYIGALLTYSAGLLLPDLTDTKRLILGLAGTGLLIFSGILHNSKIKIEAGVSHGALNAITQIYNRVAEQLSSADLEKAKIIIKGLERAPHAILKIVNNTSSEPRQLE